MTALTDKNATFVIGGWDHPTVVLLIGLATIFSRRFVLWTDTPRVQLKSPSFKRCVRAIVLRIIFSKSYAVMGTGRMALLRLQEMGASPEKLINFPYWVELSPFYTLVGWRKRTTGVWRLLSSGRVDLDRKGQDIALRALALLKIRFGIIFEYRICGEGQDRERVIQLVKALGLTKEVCLLGWQEPAQVISEMMQSQFFLHPSPTHEAYGVAVLEAMAAGAVVFASSMTFAGHDRIVHGVNGFLHQAGDYEELARQLAVVIQNPELGELVSARAAETARAWPVAKGVETISRLVGLNQ
jgi:glycosyltransferase involved in cell wall biosynthesis